MKNKYLPYTIHFVSFMLEYIETDKIKNITLFGSTARNEATKESDIDIFIDINAKEKEYSIEVKKIIEKFYESKFYQNYWNIKGLDNSFNVIIGDINKWKELKDNIISTGITLYTKFKSIPDNQKHSLLIYFENIKPETKRVLLYKNLYGYNTKGKHYTGLIEKYNGIKINKGTVLVPLEYKNLLLSLFKRYNITIKTRNITYPCTTNP